MIEYDKELEKKDTTHRLKCLSFCDLAVFPSNSMLWDKKSPFKLGIAEVQKNFHFGNSGEYCVVSFNPDIAVKGMPYIVKDFGNGVFKRFGRIWVKPEAKVGLDRIKLTGNTVIDNLNSPFSDPVLAAAATKFEPSENEVVVINLDSDEKIDEGWIIDGITNDDEARDWLRKNGGGQGVHFLKSKEKLIERIKMCLDKKYQP